MADAHKPGCEALGGYGHGVGPCTCGADTPSAAPSDAELYGDDCPGVRGDTRTPQFGEWMRLVFASASNPHRYGMFVRTTRNTGRYNPGVYHELTDGKGDFWSCKAESTVFIDPVLHGADPTKWGAPPTVAREPLTDERQAFEAFWRREMNTEAMDLARTNYPMTPPEKQQYLCHETERAWITWQERAHGIT